MDVRAMTLVDVVDLSQVELVFNTKFSQVGTPGTVAPAPNLPEGQRDRNYDSRCLIWHLVFSCERLISGTLVYGLTSIAWRLWVEMSTYWA